VDAHVTVCSISIPRTAPSIEWEGDSVVVATLLTWSTGLACDTSYVVDSSELTTRSDTPRRTTDRPQVVDTAICMYMSGLSGILLGRPIAPDRCIPQNTLVVPARRTTSCTLDAHVGNR